LIPINAARDGCRHKHATSVKRTVGAFVPEPSKVAERLLAHARLCRHIAEQSWSEEAAQRLSALADECTRAAAELAPSDSAHHDT